jgi:hypothetical protein
MSSTEIKKSSMESKHHVMKCSLKTENNTSDTHALIDCRATGIVSINKDFIHHYCLQGKELEESRQLKVIDRRPIESGTITTMA